jgi:hypothetical protein
VFDRDGLFDSWLSALWYKIWKGGEISYSEDRGEWYVSERIEEPLRAEGAIVHYKRNFEWYKGSWTDASFGDWFLSGGRVIDGPYFGGTAPCPGFGRGTGFLRVTKQSTGAGNMARTLGVQGERAVGTLGSKVRIESLTGMAKYRIPDKLTASTLTEVKNVSRLSYTRQLRDFNLYSQKYSLEFELFTRPNTKLSGPLLNQIRKGNIILKTIP